MSGSNKENVGKEIAITVIQVIDAINSYAEGFFPPLKVLGFGVGVLLDRVDDSGDKDMDTLKTGFKTINNNLDELAKQNRKTLENIQLGVACQQFNTHKGKLETQYRELLSLIATKPEFKDHKKEAFENAYRQQGSDTPLNAVYDCVVGKTKLFSKPLLEMYRAHFKNEPEAMKRLVHEVLYVLGIGIMTQAAYKFILNGDADDVIQKWEQNMEEVLQKTKEFQ